MPNLIIGIQDVSHFEPKKKCPKCSISWRVLVYENRKNNVLIRIIGKSLALGYCEQALVNSTSSEMKYQSLNHNSLNTLGSEFFRYKPPFVRLCTYRVSKQFGRG